jgi:hypothetical protein
MRPLPVLRRSWIAGPRRCAPSMRCRRRRPPRRDRPLTRTRVLRYNVRRVGLIRPRARPRVAGVRAARGGGGGANGKRRRVGGAGHATRRVVPTRLVWRTCEHEAIPENPAGWAQLCAVERPDGRAMLTLHYIHQPEQAEWRQRVALARGTPHYARQRARRRGDVSLYLTGNRELPFTSRNSASAAPADGAARWLAPWDARHYPGRLRLLRAVIGGNVTDRTVWRWRSGGRALPVWAAVALIGGIEARCETGARLVAALRAHIAVMAARPKPGDRFRALRAAGVGPPGLGARGKMRSADPSP